MTAGVASVGLVEADLRQRAIRDPVLNDLFTPGTVRRAAAVEVLDHRSEDPATLDRVGDHGGGGRQVGDDATFEVEDEVRIGGQVEQPGAWLRAGDAAQVDRIVDPAEDRLDPTLLAGTPPLWW